jgi:valine--pyruvate aminotransferase
MSYEFSSFGRHLGCGSGIEELMKDLGHALADGGPDLKMLGGGQPARIPEVNAVWRRQLEELIDEPGGIERAITSYDPPRGNQRFLEAVAGLFRRTFGWDISHENIAITPGGQTAFFYLFNLLAGQMPDGSRRKILLPLIPEYIGYTDQGIDGSLFHATRPLIEHTGPHEFKYRVDFDRLQITPEIAAICASRPTNPTGNVLTDGEIARLSALARDHGIPLIIDNAYGAPFPGIIFTGEATPFWEPHVVLTYSLSKIGLPGTRTGIVIGPPELIRAVASMSAIVGLSNPGIGQQILLPLVESGEILTLSQEVIQPFYRDKCALARQAAHTAFADRFEWSMHCSEGALFLWLWFPGLPVTSKVLYQRLKQRGVLVVPGEYFFFGDHADWPHHGECIRVSYAMDQATVRDGLEIIAREVASLHHA